MEYIENQLCYNHFTILLIELFENLIAKNKDVLLFVNVETLLYMKIWKTTFRQIYFSSKRPQFVLLMIG